jgi:hypothetical protein
MSVDDMQSLVSDFNCVIKCTADEEIKLGCLEVLSNADLLSAVIFIMHEKNEISALMKNDYNVFR